MFPPELTGPIELLVLVLLVVPEGLFVFEAASVEFPDDSPGKLGRFVLSCLFGGSVRTYFVNTSSTFRGRSVSYQKKLRR